MDNGLQHSVARVLTGEDPRAPEGTAFLFGETEGEQLWMTCHHVVRWLPSLRLGFYANQKLTEIEVEYCETLSSVQADVAVLKTHLDQNTTSSLEIRPLPFGDPSVSEEHKDWNLHGCGMELKVDRYPHGIPFYGKFLHLHPDIPSPADNAEETDRIQALTNRWNIPFAERHLRLYEFRDENDRLDHVFSGSPICLLPKSPYEPSTCIGMLSAMRGKNAARHGFVIPFDVIDAACGHRLPFHRFAACVVVVLAAKRNEIEALHSKMVDGGPKNEVTSRLPNYHDASRDEWRPFKTTDPAITNLFREISSELKDTLPPWQLASSYLDWDDGKFRNYLASPELGPLVYVIDPFSTDVDAIRAVVKEASNTHRKAHYIYALCATIESTTREHFKDHLRTYLSVEFWRHPHSRRVEPAEDPHAFRNRLGEAIRKACSQFAYENRDTLRHGEPSASWFNWGSASPR